MQMQGKMITMMQVTVCLRVHVMNVQNDGVGTCVDNHMNRTKMGVTHGAYFRLLPCPGNHIPLLSLIIDPDMSLEVQDVVQLLQAIR